LKNDKRQDRLEGNKELKTSLILTVIQKILGEEAKVSSKSMNCHEGLKKHR
jgi:hypothetical protein